MNLSRVVWPNLPYAGSDLGLLPSVFGALHTPLCRNLPFAVSRATRVSVHQGKPLGSRHDTWSTAALG